MTIPADSYAGRHEAFFRVLFVNNMTYVCWLPYQTHQLKIARFDWSI